MLDDLDDFVAFLKDNHAVLFAPPKGGAASGTNRQSCRLHCPVCGDARRMDVEPAWWTGGKLGINRDTRGHYAYWSATQSFEFQDVRSVLPSLYFLMCRDCDAIFTALIYPGPEGPELVILPKCRGGLTTKNTPKSVAYYLDQAARAHSLGANSAAVAMYRSALEQLLYGQSYTVKMLGPKIKALETAIEKGAAPEWATSIDPAVMIAINKLATEAIHPNDGDISVQKKFDNDLIAEIQAAFRFLLDVVYEAPLKKKANLQALTDAQNPPAESPDKK